MYRRTKFIEILHEIRQEMAAEADYDVVLFAENVRSGSHAGGGLKKLKNERSAAAKTAEPADAEPLARGL
ncbi:MAG: hypothetical protein KA746_00955 [Pyrinomonadaceae bacterium]|nr:hypothetical protein [Pyrinomonadaceae bacterium]MBP6213564.1 hypothetical protein [Pyrinomonadaceae bacterium]